MVEDETAAVRRGRPSPSSIGWTMMKGMMMRTPQETSKSLRSKVMAAMRAAAHLKRYKLEYIDINVTAEPGEPELYKEQGCNGDELLALLDAFDLSNT